RHGQRAPGDELALGHEDDPRHGEHEDERDAEQRVDRAVHHPVLGEKEEDGRAHGVPSSGRQSPATCPPGGEGTPLSRRERVAAKSPGEGKLAPAYLVSVYAQSHAPLNGCRGESEGRRLAAGRLRRAPSDRAWSRPFKHAYRRAITADRAEASTCHRRS